MLLVFKSVFHKEASCKGYSDGIHRLKRWVSELKLTDVGEDARDPHERPAISEPELHKGAQKDVERNDGCKVKGCLSRCEVE